uniref:Peptidase S1 domain-containing protein n=1 Tax=Glossina brevipalpis TaxID=37001 RepID=A0A1A9WJB4_9MUSC
MLGSAMKLIFSPWTLYIVTITVVSANECALNTECKPIANCPFIRDNFNLIKRKPYCNLDRSGTHVCCRKPPQNYTQTKDIDLRIVRECRYYDSLPRRCDLPFIVGGTQADPKEFPFMSLLYRKDGNKFTHLCGGTLISKKYVLTAAHCFYDTPTPPNWVRLGELDYSTNTDDALPQDFEVKNFIRHHEYYTTDIQTKYNDIALVELGKEAIFNDYVSPACLPLVDGNDFQEFLTAGWGKTNYTSESSTHLLKVKLDRFDDDKCFQIIERNEELEKGVNNRTQLCAGSFSDNRDTCAGDSGGPLFVNHPEFSCQFLVVGITSFGEGGCGNKGIPAVYTRVKLYIDWIERIVWD